jgi:subtilase family serine protease
MIASLTSNLCAKTRNNPQFERLTSSFLVLCHQNGGVSMKYSMKKAVMNSMALAMMLATSAGLYGQTSSASKKNTFEVRVAYQDDGKIIPNADVYLSYYDENTSALVDKTAKTGNGRTVSFQIPLNGDGSSYSFIVLFSKEDVARAKEVQKNHNLRMYRRPPGENCEYLELRIRKGGGGTNQGCAVQISVK